MTDARFPRRVGPRRLPDRGRGRRHPARDRLHLRRRPAPEPRDRRRAARRAAPGCRRRTGGGRSPWTRCCCGPWTPGGSTAPRFFTGLFRRIPDAAAAALPRRRHHAVGGDGASACAPPWARCSAPPLELPFLPRRRPPRPTNRREPPMTLLRDHDLAHAFDHASHTYDRLTALNPGYRTDLLRSARRLRLPRRTGPACTCWTSAAVPAPPPGPCCGPHPARGSPPSTPPRACCGGRWPSRWPAGVRFRAPDRRGTRRRPTRARSTRSSPPTCSATSPTRTASSPRCATLLRPGGRLAVHEYSLSGSPAHRAAVERRVPGRDHPGGHADRRPRPVPAPVAQRRSTSTPLPPSPDGSPAPDSPASRGLPARRLADRHRRTRSWPGAACRRRPERVDERPSAPAGRPPGAGVTARPRSLMPAPGRGTASTGDAPSVAVVGGGIAGLAAATAAGRTRRPGDPVRTRGRTRRTARRAGPPASPTAPGRP